jgi:hypothetical protein
MVRSNPAVLRRLLEAPSGPVGRDLRRRGTSVQNRAKILAGAKRAVDTGRLRSSIEVTDPRSHPRGQVVSVGSNLKYALAVHEGSGSKYAPRSWRIAHARGRPVPPRRYLTEALPAASR